MFHHLASSPDARPPAESRPECEADPIAALETMFVDIVMGRRIAGGQSPVLRPVFLKPHGVARATLTVRPDLPQDRRVGVFAGTSYDAWVRFSSDTVPSSPDLRTTCGIAIKLFGVPGKKLLPPDTDAPTHDFLLQNHDVFFVDDAKAFCEFTHAGVVDADYPAYLAAHSKTRRILDDMAKLVPSVLSTSYWSGLPFRFGPDRHVKYKLVPAGHAGDALPGLSTDDPNYLHDDLRARLLEAEASFHFMAQFAVDDERTPLDRATHRWQESVSPPVHLATLTFPRQDVDAPGQAAYGEDLAFNTWHALAEHEPVGSLAQARRVVYQAAAGDRRRRNGASLDEPTEPRAVERDPEGRDRTIVKAKIHPAIGIARVGNSEDHYFIGPEVTDPEPRPDGYKDDIGALLRQGARFRVYGYNAAGEAVAELTPTSESTQVTWSVHVANAKAAWYEFQIALDIPEARFEKQVPSKLRNASLVGSKRDALTIDGGSRTISGVLEHGPQYRFDSGTFMGKKVVLGELRTDEEGRLVFLGGHGVSASSDGTPLKDFANNDKWHDDVSDGPVTAEVTIDGRSIPVDPAWVVVAPPNYGPGLVTVRTMHDLLFDVFVRSGAIPFPDRVSFTEHVLPIFQRLANLQWVNHGFATKYGANGREDFMDPAYLERLASDSEEQRELRQQIWSVFRDWTRDGESPVPWPWLYGDSMSIPPISPRQHATLSPTQMGLLERWAKGDFEPDLDLGAQPPRSVEELPLSAQPEMLDRAALTFCLADAFHPGCEMTWPIRHASMFMAPFRLRHRPIGDSEPNLGTTLTPDAVSVVNGPLFGQSPGSLTRWMAVPWQGDTASCLSGYTMGFERRYDPYLPTFWPARVPNDVLTEHDYAIVMDESLPIGERRAAFERRAHWLRWLVPQYPANINEMVDVFGKLGVIEARPGPADGAFPAWIHVESQVGWEHHVNPLRGRRALHVPEALHAEGAEAERLLGAAVDAAPHDNEEYTVGYMRRVEPFGGRRR